MISPSERPEYSQVEQDCKGCMGPCGRCHELASERPDALQQAREALHAEINICMAIGRSSPKLTAAIDHLLLVQRQSLENTETCLTCAHHVSDGCLHPAMVAVSYSSLYFHPPTPDFSCSFHADLLLVQRQSLENTEPDDDGA
jgi:hypothetical protein